jgi:hypothetical protein
MRQKLVLAEYDQLRASIIMPSQSAKSWPTSQKSSVEREKRREREKASVICPAPTTSKKKCQLLAWCERKRRHFLQLLDPVRRSAAARPSHLLCAKVHHNSPAKSHQIDFLCAKLQQTKSHPQSTTSQNLGQSRHHRHRCEMGRQSKRARASAPQEIPPPEAPPVRTPQLGSQAV